MSTDTIVSEKKLRSDAEIVRKLLELRDSIWKDLEDKHLHSFADQYIFYKINSCLYEPKEKKSHVVHSHGK